MSTLLQLVNEVLRRTGQVEVTTLVNAQTPVVQTRDFLNETYFEMLQRLKTERLQKTGTLSTVNGTASYALASDAEINSLIPDSVLDIASQQLLREVDYTYPLTHGPTVTGRPECFYRTGSLLYLYPVPNAVFSVQYQYLIKPITLSADADTTQLPVEWEKVLILGTQARLENFLGEGGSDTYLLYRDGLAQLKSRAPLKPYRRMRGFYRGYS
ncbi:MAG TPA: hypothetical protein V6C52_00730 [Coleofasciculaceae cyanobacterium]|jgi:hypothetical protein